MALEEVCKLRLLDQDNREVQTVSSTSLIFNRCEALGLNLSICEMGVKHHWISKQKEAVGVEKACKQ